MQNLLIGLMIILAASCSHIRTREQIESGKGQEKGETVTTGKEDVKVPEELPSLPPEMTRPELRVGIVFGPSGMLAPAQIGVLQELTRTRLPIHAVGGMEMGALVAALYASEGRSNDAEWKFFKLKEEDVLSKSFIRGSVQPRSIKELQTYLQENLGTKRIEKAELPFACPSLNIRTASSRLMQSGSFTEAMQYCMAYPPFWEPYSDHLSHTSNYGELASALRKAGANYIILVQVNPQRVDIGPSSLGEWGRAIWAMALSESKQKQMGYDEVISINPGKYGITDFASRREILRLGRDQGRRAAQKLVDAHGL